MNRTSYFLLFRQLPYDAQGNRVLKEDTGAGGAVSKRTWYVRDAAGQHLTTYEQSGGSGTPRAKEYLLYGSSRLGTAYADNANGGAPVSGALYRRVVGQKQYEVADHLGNVRATVGDVKVRSGSILKKKRTRMKYLYIILLIILNSCVNDRCYSVPQIKVSYAVMATSYSQSYDYCGLLERSVEKDEKAILKFSLLGFDGEDSYDHGDVLLQLISLIGEDEYLKAIKNISAEEKGVIYSHVRCGIEYGQNFAHKNSTLEKEFPIVTKFLLN